jgi:hypothetical protein
VTPIGFEPITCPLGGGCSIQLSHGALIISYSNLSDNLASHETITWDIMGLYMGLIAVTR